MSGHEPEDYFVSQKENRPLGRLGTSVKRSVRIAKSRNSAVDLTVLPQVFKKQAHTHSVRDLNRAIGMADDGGKIMDFFRNRPRRKHYSKRNILPSVSSETIDRAIPFLALTLSLGAFVAAAVLLCSPRPAGVHRL